MRYADRDHKKTKRAVLWRSVSIFFSLYFVWWFRSLLLFLFFFSTEFYSCRFERRSFVVVFF